jgi:hypothetical protein
MIDFGNLTKREQAIVRRAFLWGVRMGLWEFATLDQTGFPLGVVELGDRLSASVQQMMNDERKDLDRATRDEIVLAGKSCQLELESHVMAMQRKYSSGTKP